MEPDVFAEIDPTTLVEAYLLATKLVSQTDNSFKRLHSLHSFTLLCKRMFLSDSSAKVYALLYRNKMQRLKSQIKEASSLDSNPTQKEHPIKQAAKFIAEVAFFGDSNDDDESRYPD